LRTGRVANSRPGRLTSRRARHDGRPTVRPCTCEQAPDRRPRMSHAERCTWHRRDRRARMLGWRARANWDAWPRTVDAARAAAHVTERRARRSRLAAPASRPASCCQFASRRRGSQARSVAGGDMPAVPTGS
jgi:hypothetical protein